VGTPTSFSFRENIQNATAISAVFSFLTSQPFCFFRSLSAKVAKTSYELDMPKQKRGMVEYRFY
jgi:hypothetical protein